MRARTSWPRSSVPSGWAHDGALSLALKSISSMGTRYTSGPVRTASTMRTRTTEPKRARRWRRNRRQASAVSDEDFRRAAVGGAPAKAPAAGLPVRDARIEAAIEDIRDEVEEDHQPREHEGDGHDHRGVVGEDGADEERADAGYAEDLLGDEGAGEDGGNLQRHQGDHRDEGIAHRLPGDGHALGESLRPRGADVVELDHVEHRGAHEAGHGRGLKEAEDGDGHDGLPDVLPPPAPAGGADVGPVDEGEPVQVDAEKEDEEQPGEKRRQRKAEEGASGGDLVEEGVGARRRVDPDGDGDEEAQELRGADDEDGGGQPLQDDPVHVDAAHEGEAPVPLHHGGG